MSAALLDDLLSAFAVPTPAKAANPANRESGRGLAADSTLCEGLRILANPAGTQTQGNPDSQTFAAVRNPSNGPGSKERCGLSQNSQNSQGYPSTRAAPEALDLDAVAWSADDIERFLDRRTRLLRWGWAEPEAERLAERLVIRDREADPRVSCTDCKHYRVGLCGNHRRAGLQAPDVGRDLAALLQRCPGFNSSEGAR
jgi:hypothetical protein